MVRLKKGISMHSNLGMRRSMICAIMLHRIANVSLEMRERRDVNPKVEESISMRDNLRAGRSKSQKCASMLGRM